MASVFISHSSLDGQVVEDIYAFLGDHEHHAVFLDRDPHDGIRVGDLWETKLYDHLHDADVVVCIVTQNHVDSRWCFAEVAVAKSLGRRVLPVGAQEGVRHPLLEPVQALDYLTDPDAAKSALSERLRVIEAAGGLAWDPSRPLFPGLAPFDTSDAPVFFGREAETEKLAALVRAQAIQRASKAVVVVGGSGSGKSSLVRAGLIPRLVAEGWVAVPPVLPGPDPMGSLTFAIAQAWRDASPTRAVDLEGLSRQVNEDLSGVADGLLVAAGSTQGLLLVVDQFEEVFTRAASGSAERFLAVLDAAAEAGRRTAVVATMRSEFMSELLASEPAGRLRENQFPLAPLGRALLASIVERPARKGRLELSDDLVRRLVEDTGSGEALPLLAYALRLLTERSQPGDHIGTEQYDRIGGVQGALRVQADDALGRAMTETGLSADEILAALVEMVSIDAAGRPARRRVPRAGVASELLRAFEVFVDARLVSSDDVDGEPQFAVTHEALFTAWPQLSAAITGQVERLQLRRRLEQSAADWEQAGREPSILWRGEQLRQARAAVADSAGWSDRERRFVEASSAADEEGRRRDADIVADRIRAAGLVERDSELALLLLLVAADRYAATDSVIGGLRQTLARHRLVGRISPTGPHVTALAVSDDGQAFAAADLGTNVYVAPSTRPPPLAPAAQVRVDVWRAETLELFQTIWIHGRRAWALGLRDGPAGLRAAVGVDDRIVVADVATGAPVNDGISLGSPVRSVALSHDGERVVARTVEGSVLVVDVASGARESVTPIGADPSAGPEKASRSRPRFDRPDDTVVDDGDWPDAFRDAGWNDPPSSALSAYSVPARMLVTFDAYGIALHRVEPVDAPTPIGQVDGQVVALRWHDDGLQRAITADGRVIDLATNEALGPLGTVRAVSRDGTYVLLDQPPRIHEIASGKAHPLATKAMRSAGFSEDGARLAVASRVSLSVFEVRTGRLLARFGEHNDPEGDVYCGVGLSQDGMRLVTTSLGGGRAHVWDIATGEPVRPAPQRLLDVSPDGANVVERSFREIAADLSAGLEIQLCSDTYDVVVTLAPDRRATLAMRPLGGYPATGLVEEYSLPEGHPLFIDTEPSVAAAFSADGKHLLLARPNGRIEIAASRDAGEVLARARSHVFRTIAGEDLASFGI